ncbi:MAG: hypothetical protein ACQEWV_21115 [Bacillota bacterium]
MTNWTTPKELARKREIRNKLITYSFPLLAIIIGTLVTIVANGF